MKIKVQYKFGVVAMNFRGKSKGSFENHRDVSSIVSNLMCEKGHPKFLNDFKCKI